MAYTVVKERKTRLYAADLEVVAYTLLRVDPTIAARNDVKLQRETLCGDFNGKLPDATRYSVLFNANRYFSIAEDLLNLLLYSYRGSNLLIANFHAPDVPSNKLFRAYRLTDRDDPSEINYDGTWFKLRSS